MNLEDCVLSVSSGKFKREEMSIPKLKAIHQIFDLTMTHSENLLEAYTIYKKKFAKKLKMMAGEGLCFQT